MSALKGVRVIELAHERAALTGKLLGDMGADVILVEPPEGAAMRRHEPFAGDRPDPEMSLAWWHYNTSKRGIVLDWRKPDGRAALLELIAGADILLEAEDPGLLASAGLTDEKLTGAIPKLIHLSITPFGPDGPRCTEQATDLTLIASGGIAAVCGYDDHSLPPIRPVGDHGLSIGQNFAFLSALTALVARELQGMGQRIDVSLNAAVNVTTETATYNWLVAQLSVSRQTGRHASPFPTTASQYRCRDGRYVNTGVPPRTAKQFQMMLTWLNELGIIDEFPEAIFLEMGTQHPVLDLTKIGIDDEVTAIADAGREALVFAASRMDSYEFFLSAQKAGLPVGVIYSPEEAFEDEHFKARGFQVEVDQPQMGGPVRYPGAPYRFEKSPWAIARPAPRLGEHTDEVLREAAIDGSVLKDQQEMES